jgi:hypothetical protein
MGETKPEIWVPVSIGIIMIVLFLAYCMLHDEASRPRRSRSLLESVGGPRPPHPGAGARGYPASMFDTEFFTATERPLKRPKGVYLPPMGDRRMSPPPYRSPYGSSNKGLWRRTRSWERIRTPPGRAEWFRDPYEHADIVERRPGWV